MLAPEVETLPWNEQLALDDASYRTQLIYLFERSRFYREKLAAAGLETAADAGGLADIVELPLTDKQELRATCAPDEPMARTSARTRPSSSGSTRRAARPEPRATSP
jgi:phenylacetate-CoA ligase